MCVCRGCAETKGDSEFSPLPRCCRLQASQPVESNIFNKICSLENYTLMLMNINTKMNLKALQDLQRMAWLKTGAKICSGISIFKENDTLGQNTSRCIMP